MDQHLEADIIASLEASPELLPWLPELLADLSALGSVPELIVEMVRPLDLPAVTTVADLGCGKGAVALALAEAFGFRVIGVDGFPPFITEARLQAVRRGLDQLCEFRCADLRHELSPAVPYDLLILAGVGPLFGDFAATVRQLRQAVRPGGFLIIDDCFAAGAQTSGQPQFAHYLPHSEMIRALESCGDRMIHEVIFSAAEMQAMNQVNNSLIRRRAERLTREHPEAEPLLMSYVARQEAECEFLETELQCAVWLLQRAEN